MSQTKLTPFPRRFNVKPTQDVLILAKSALEPLMARWWLVPSWFKGEEVTGWKATNFNSRTEEVNEKPFFPVVGSALASACSRQLATTNGRPIHEPLMSSIFMETSQCCGVQMPIAQREIL